MATPEPTAAQLRQQAEGLFAKAGEAGGEAGRGYRQQAAAKLVEAADVEKAEAARPTPRKLTRPGVLNKVVSPDLIKSAVTAAVHEAMLAYEDDLESIENDLARLLRAQQTRYAPVTREPARPDIEARKKELLTKADDCRREDPTRARGYREMARLLDD